MVQTIITRKSFDETAQLLKDQYRKLAESGTFYAVFSTEYDRRGSVVHDFLDVIDLAVEIGYTYVNTIVYPTARKQSAAFADNVRYIVWLCKDHGKMRFDKDAIREKHIWKDVEWGKRAKNYNPKGKDPGNVWIPTEDDGAAHITRHLLLSDREVVDRLLKMSGCGENCALFLGDLPEAALPLKPSPPENAPAPARAAGQVIFGTAENMDRVADASVDAVVTSPPYWNLKDYFKAGQIGQEPYEQYLRRMKTVWAQCYQKLRPRGSLWININIRVQADRVILLPRDFVRLCKEIGFFYKGILIWHKSSGIPTGSRNIVDRHEYLLVFTKAQEADLDRGILETFGDYKNPEINGGAFWNINRKAGSVGKKFIHPAIFPTELVRRIVLAASPSGGTVLDPFLGSGTSLIAALQGGRSFVGYEYNQGFRELMESRFAKELAPEDGEILFFPEDEKEGLPM